MKGINREYKEHKTIILKLSINPMLKNFLSSERAQWIFLIGLIAIGGSLTAKNVFSYPAECKKQVVNINYIQTFASTEGNSLS